MCECEKKAAVAEVPADKIEEVKKLVAGYREKPGALILVLQAAQEICGFLPPKIQQLIAEGLNISPAEVYSVVTFYSFFTQVPRGKNVIRVCMGTACFVGGSDKILTHLEQHLNLKPGQTSPDMKYTLEEVRCVGACGLAPVVTMNQHTFGVVDPNKIAKLIDDATQ